MESPGNNMGQKHPETLHFTAYNNTQPDPPSSPSFSRRSSNLPPGDAITNSRTNPKQPVSLVEEDRTQKIPIAPMPSHHSAFSRTAHSPNGANNNSVPGKEEHNTSCHYCAQRRDTPDVHLCSQCPRLYCNKCLREKLAVSPSSLGQPRWICPKCSSICCCCNNFCPQQHPHCHTYKRNNEYNTVYRRNKDPAAFEPAARPPKVNTPTADDKRNRQTPTTRINTPTFSQLGATPRIQKRHRTDEGEQGDDSSKRARLMQIDVLVHPTDEGASAAERRRPPESEPDESPLLHFAAAAAAVQRHNDTLTSDYGAVGSAADGGAGLARAVRSEVSAQLDLLRRELQRRDYELLSSLHRIELLLRERWLSSPSTPNAALMKGSPSAPSPTTRPAGARAASWVASNPLDL